MRILIADDDPVSRRILNQQLASWDFEVEQVDRGDAALDALSDPEGPRLAIIDWMMPGLDGVEVCRQLRAKDALPFSYLILLTARDSKQAVVEALEAGADDYLTKPYDAAELRSRIRVGARTILLHERLEEANRTLEVIAHTDALTQVMNRYAVLNVLQRELERSARNNAPVAVVMLDLDHFKQINDTFGHSAGDQVLREAANRMRKICRGYDSVGRYGGEEFLIVVPEVTAEAAEGLALRLGDVLRQTPFEVEGHALEVTASIGMVWLPVAPAGGMDAILRQADGLLYTAKRAGRDRASFSVADCC